MGERSTRRLAALDGAAVQVEHEIGRAEATVLGLAEAPSRDRADAREQLGEREGLGQVVVGAEFEPAHAVAHRAARREEEDGRLHARLAQPAQHLEALHVGQHHVEQDQVVAAVGGALDAARAIGDDFDEEAVLAEALEDVLLRRRIVFDVEKSQCVPPAASAGRLAGAA